MKNLKQIALGLMVGAMAISFSAFTNAPKNAVKVNRNAKGQIISVTSSYFRLPAFASATTDLNPSHYEFSNGVHAGCNAASDICSSEWTTTNAPVKGDSPSTDGSPSFDSDNAIQGVYNGN